MKERPILMSDAMVVAALADRKLQTRRIVAIGAQYPLGKFEQRDPGKWLLEKWERCDREMGNFGRCEDVVCPYGAAGDRLWVREASAVGQTEPYLYRSTFRGDPKTVKWRPSIFMPRAACRLKLGIAEIRVERLQAITEADALAEGIPADDGTECAFSLKTSGADMDDGYDRAVDAYADLWDSLNKARGFGWNVNPWVWVICFRRVVA